jgi:hypothetical protein
VAASISGEGLPIWRLRYRAHDLGVDKGDQEVEAKNDMKQSSEGDMMPIFYISMLITGKIAEHAALRHHNPSLAAICSCIAFSGYVGTVCSMIIAIANRRSK